MSKKYIGKICVYCGIDASETGDHIFARSFFLKSQRADLPQVPACRKCNRAKSTLEHYLASILPFGGRHADAKTNLETMVPGRLEKNQKLKQNIVTTKTPVLSKEASGLILPTIAIPIDSNRLTKLFYYVVKGLTYHHWDNIIDFSTEVEVFLLNKNEEERFNRIFLQGKSELVHDNLGNNTFTYRGIRSTEDQELSVWQFSIYGGIQITNDNNTEQISTIGAWTLDPKKAAKTSNKSLVLEIY